MGATGTPARGFTKGESVGLMRVRQMAAVAVVAALAACGGGSGGDDEAVGRGSTSTTMSSTSAPVGEPDPTGGGDVGSGDGITREPGAVEAIVVDPELAAGARANAAVLFPSVFDQVDAATFDPILREACALAQAGEGTRSADATAAAIVAAIPDRAEVRGFRPASIMLASGYLNDGGCGRSAYLTEVKDALIRELGEQLTASGAIPAS